MFEAPEIFKQIPDIAQIYTINDRQSLQLDAATQELEDNLFLETMSEEQTGHWETILNILPSNSDTLKDRRMRVKTKILERLPYSYRVICSRLTELCPNGYTLLINDTRTELKVVAELDSNRQIDILEEFLDSTLPVNICFEVESGRERTILAVTRIANSMTSQEKKVFIYTAEEGENCKIL